MEDSVPGASLDTVAKRKIPTFQELTQVIQSIAEMYVLNMNESM
jgi:hypothetical protein